MSEQAEPTVLDALRKGMDACQHPEVIGGEIRLLTKDGKIVERFFSFTDDDDFRWLATHFGWPPR